ncbi:MAG: hypothetical protein QOG09_788 [Solirubrobacterales bacterium]|nr:hypothetical protein [Solirubrobacterales bacterium]MDX6662686.1 hypothetical protein [Solirubrobacterales bacterium]
MFKAVAVGSVLTAPVAVGGTVLLNLLNPPRAIVLLGLVAMVAVSVVVTLELDHRNQDPSSR